MLRKTLAAALITLTAFAAPVTAQDLPGYSEVNRMLFAARKNSVVVQITRTDLLDAKFQKALKLVGEKQKYYGAVAMSPSRGFLNQASVVLARMHNAQVAQLGAVEQCNERISSGPKDCVVVALILPKGYEAPVPVMMNFDATEDFGKAYRRLGKPRAFATSEATGEWGFGAGTAAALAACNEKSRGIKDCVAVSAD